jgi:hypothetical protein
MAMQSSLNQTALGGKDFGRRWAGLAEGKPQKTRETVVLDRSWRADETELSDWGD